jgi:hypothetical protein
VFGGNRPHVQQRNAGSKERRVGVACADRPCTDSRNRCKNGPPRRQRWRSSETGPGGLNPEWITRNGPPQVDHPGWPIQGGFTHGGSSMMDRPRWIIQNGCVQEWLATERGRRRRPEASRDGQRRRQEPAPQTLWAGADSRNRRHVTTGSISKPPPITSTS